VDLFLATTQNWLSMTTVVMAAAAAAAAAE
jgi:hypothetical protein